MPPTTKLIKSHQDSYIHTGHARRTPAHLHRRRRLLPAFLNAALPASQFVKASQTHQQAASHIPHPPLTCTTNTFNAASSSHSSTPPRPASEFVVAARPHPTPTGPRHLTRRPSFPTPSRLQPRGRPATSRTQAPTPFPPLSPTTARRATTPGRLATPHTPLAGHDAIPHPRAPTTARRATTPA
ncbi:hypothetical protein BC826DRAFT_593521 [Russula brevipes]|nr:hypothetical protein BC826DRAFT_593521 [Russula brevipes]